MIVGYGYNCTHLSKNLSCVTELQLILTSAATAEFITEVQSYKQTLINTSILYIGITNIINSCNKDITNFISYCGLYDFALLCCLMG